MQAATLYGMPDDDSMASAPAQAMQIMKDIMDSQTIRRWLLSTRVFLLKLCWIVYLTKRTLNGPSSVIQPTLLRRPAVDNKLPRKGQSIQGDLVPNIYNMLISVLKYQDEQAAEKRRRDQKRRNSIVLIKGKKLMDPFVKQFNKDMMHYATIARKVGDYVASSMRIRQRYHNKLAEINEKYKEKIDDEERQLESLKEDYNAQRYEVLVGDKLAQLGFKKLRFRAKGQTTRQT